MTLQFVNKQLVLFNELFKINIEIKIKPNFLKNLKRQVCCIVLTVSDSYMVMLAITLAVKTLD